MSYYLGESVCWDFATLSTMTHPHNQSPYPQGNQNSYQPHTNVNHPDPYAAHQSVPYGTGAQPFPAVDEPQTSSSSTARWLILVVLILALVLAGLGFAAYCLISGNDREDLHLGAPLSETPTAVEMTTEASSVPSPSETAEASKNPTSHNEEATQVEAAPLAPLEGLPADYFDHSLSMEEADKIREGEIVEAPVPEELAGLTDTCIQSASFFGKPDDQGFFSSGMVPTITCFFGKEGELQANYTRNKDAIAAAAKPVKEHVGKLGSLSSRLNLAGRANEVKTTRGSMLFLIYNSHEGQKEFVMSEVLAGETAAIEYISDTSQVLLRQPLVDAGIVERDRK